MKTPHREQILEYMKQFGSINPLQALQDIGCFRLASRISELKKLGYHIRSERVNYTTRFGEAKHYHEYRLEED